MLPCHQTTAVAATLPTKLAKMVASLWQELAVQNSWLPSHFISDYKSNNDFEGIFDQYLKKATVKDKVR
ncbi:hypothetical protein TIFTF001_008614 [Ficus carica]|uniref:Uncharacterized protein n=1 Tax=Ficus carica TaxID=3494 RepID=A0AA87ZST1_FICCA|nr:hypothetical protein TIFTF001_008614 [Ficus carica]